MAVAEDEKNFVGLGGMGNLPCLSAVGGGCCGGFDDNGADIFTGATCPSGYVGGGIGSVETKEGIGGADGIPF